MREAERKPNGRNGATAGHGPDGAPARNGVPVPPEKRCKHRTEKGTPCRAARRKESEYCIFHDREFQQHRNEIKGARTMLDRRKTPDSAEGIHALLIRNVEELRQGKIDPRVANSIAYHAQLLMANLDDLKSERSKLIPASVEERFQELIVDHALEECEAEIRKAGDNAYPATVARRTAEQAKHGASQDADGSAGLQAGVFPAQEKTPAWSGFGTPMESTGLQRSETLAVPRGAPIPPPRVREVSPGVQEVLGPRGMPVSLGISSRDED